MHGHMDVKSGMFSASGFWVYELYIFILAYLLLKALGTGELKLCESQFS